eukprot:CAMPEP_0181514490 /NCGR_PEP_ID=MMETSP1110-20121109/63063_1 /TAXON_ID=174948 /ORGANISM="Symbiodinium sp., Strain CCMP421" /LENGTH=38 /DNA_ID= /DNA_START= /DNA_END= /DNA_ORIENTATION=
MPCIAWPQSVTGSLAFSCFSPPVMASAESAMPPKPLPS